MPGVNDRTRGGYLVLAAMIFAVGMIFIDQTIVSISIPRIQDELHLSGTGVQWVINGYLLSLAALFAFGGKVVDVLGRRRMVIVGILTFAGSSVLCGLTPAGSFAEAWLIVFRVVQGAGAAVMFPAALSIVISAFPIEKRGQAMAIFFGITGGLTSVGPILGGYLSEWTWRSIFWINVPVALISLLLVRLSRPEEMRRHQALDFRGAILICAGMGLMVLGLQQSAVWGWDSPVTWLCVVAGFAVLVWFARFELAHDNPLIEVRIFGDRAFRIDSIILGLLSIPFVPLFFLASLYSQVSLGWGPAQSGLYLLIFFGGFASAAQLGGRILDSRGARPSIILGSLLAAIGFALWASKLPDLDGGAGAQWPFIVLAGAGIGLIMGPASTDAVNRAPNTSYGEATGITQTVRNFGASLGLAVLGSVMLTLNRGRMEDSLAALGVPKGLADRIGEAVSSGGGASGGSDSKSQLFNQAGDKAGEIFRSVQMDFALSMRVIFYVMAGVMAVCFLIALVWSPHGRMEEITTEDAYAAGTGKTSGNEVGRDGDQAGGTGSPRESGPRRSRL